MLIDAAYAKEIKSISYGWDKEWIVEGQGFKFYITSTGKYIKKNVFAGYVSQTAKIPGGLTPANCKNIQQIYFVHQSNACNQQPRCLSKVSLKEDESRSSDLQRSALDVQQQHQNQSNNLNGLPCFNFGQIPGNSGGVLMLISPEMLSKLFSKNGKKI